MKKKLTITLKNLVNIAAKFSETIDFIDDNMKQVCETIKVVIYFVVFV